MSCATTKLIPLKEGIFLQEVWTAMHRDKTQVEKYMKALYIGDVEHRQLSLPVQVYIN